jgi:Zn-finger nucleic acid-binding protein
MGSEIDLPISDTMATNCPRCAVALRAIEVQPHGLLGCTSCGGVFLSHSAVGAILSGGHDRIEEMSARVATLARTHPARGHEAPCPLCATGMTPVEIRGGIAAFTCNTHGSWFDAGDVASLRGSCEPARAVSVATSLPSDGLAPAHVPTIDAASQRTFLKPTSLVVIAWLWIVFGGGWCLVSIPTLVEACSMSDQIAALGGSPEFSEKAASYSSLFALALIGAMAMAAAGAICGIALLRLREWGRRGLVVLSGLLLLYVVGFFAVYMWMALPALAQGTLIFHVAAMIGLVAFGWPLWLMLRHLRGATIRAATQRASYFSHRALDGA